MAGVGQAFGWNHTIHDNRVGFEDFIKSVSIAGCPRTRAGHSYAYRCLKDRSFAELLRRYKTDLHDKVLVVAGVRLAESVERAKIAEAVRRYGHSNLVFANPILYWSDEDLTSYRIEHNLPENPFYNTVGGSSDCQCNWGNFITLDTLKRYSPILAAGNVKTLDDLSKANHGYGWMARPEIKRKCLIKILWTMAN